MSVSVEPLARPFGITPSGFGFCTWPSTTVRTALRCRPSAMLVRKTSSRLGPTMPLVSARASAWHEPHLATNACLPTIRFASSSPLTAQPALPSASATSSAAPPMRLAARRAYRPSPVARLLAGGKLTAKPYPTGRRAGNILSVAPCRRSRLLERIQIAARGRDHAACDALPRPALAHRRDEPGARARTQRRGG